MMKPEEKPGRVFDTARVYASEKHLHALGSYLSQQVHPRLNGAASFIPCGNKRPLPFPVDQLCS